MVDKTRCAWVPEGKPDYAHYHDTQWGLPEHADRMLFGMLILEGAQAARMTDGSIAACFRAAR